MKKILVSLLVLAMCAPALAAVAVTATDEGSGVLKITVTPSDGAVVRGVSLLLGVNSGNGVVASATATELNTNIDYFAANGVGEVVGETPAGEGHPLADPTQAGVATLPAADVSLCSGYLDPAGGQGGLIIDSFFDVTYTLTLETEVSIALDTLRGGIVGDNLGAITVQGTQILALGAVECIDAGHADYTEWSIVLKPDSWCNVRQCYGDANAADEPFGKGSVWVGMDDLAVMTAGFRKVYVDPTTTDWISADFSRSDEAFGKGTVRVGMDDLAILTTNFRSATVGTDCNL